MTVKELRAALDRIEDRFGKDIVEEAIVEVSTLRQNDGEIRWHLAVSDLCVNRLQIWQDAKEDE